MIIMTVSFQKSHRLIYSYAQGRRHGGGRGSTSASGVNLPLKVSKKEKMKKYGVFSCSKVIKNSVSDIFNKEIHAL